MLVYAYEHIGRHDALSRELHIKRMSREEKIKLVKDSKENIDGRDLNY